MAETKQGGFHAFEKRVHQLEEADREAERTGKSESGSAPREAKPDEKAGAKEPPRK
jgi:hypothetical protein